MDVGLKWEVFGIIKYLPYVLLMYPLCTKNNPNVSYKHRSETRSDVLSTILFNIYINGLAGELLEDSRFSKWRSNFSTAKRRLSKKVSILEYSNTRELSLI